MLSAHEMSLRRISWGMAAVALVTASGLALTASGSRAARQVAAITDKVEAMNFGRLADLVSQPASASEIAPSQAPKIAAAAQSQSPAPQSGETASLPSAPPPAPAAPVADAAPPVPPVPPAPPAALSDEGGRVMSHAIPSEAEIRRKIPNVDIANGCENGKSVSRQETVDADGRRHIRVRICQDQIEGQANRAARAGLIAARAQIAAAARMSDKIRAEILRDLDKEIAQMDGEEGVRPD